MARKKFYITTAIDYTNSQPHIGHAYQKIAADVLSRWYSTKGYDVFFLTGTDEHGQKVAKSAAESNKTPKQFVDELSQKFIEAWKRLNIKYNRFIRTTELDHENAVQEFIRIVFKKGDIYKGEYEGLYCEGCEAFVTEKDLVNNKCPFHPNREIQKLKEETYFFKLSKYQDKLLELYEKNPEYISPKNRKEEIINRVKEGLKDLSITRTSFSWGIPFPLDKKHFVYVWYEALLNYITGIGFPDKKYKEYWPADIHLLGKDNAWFHCVIWPAMLFSAGIKPAKKIYVHGFLTFNGQKISKSLGNSISPIALAEKYGTDTVRYFTLRSNPFSEDSDFSEKSLIERNNNELANKLGNLISRVSTLAEKYGLEQTSNTLTKKLKLKTIESHLNNLEFDKCLNEIFAFIDICNEYIQNKKPWETKDKKILYELSDSIKAVSILLFPFIPETSEKISKIFNFEINYENIKKPLNISNIKKSEILFKKI